MWRQHGLASVEVNQGPANEFMHEHESCRKMLAVLGLSIKA
jgi:hypothetical protein